MTDLLAGFFDFYLPFFWFTPSVSGILSSYPVHICEFGMKKLEWLGYKWWRSHDDRLSRLGTLHQRDRHTQTDRQPLRHSKYRPTRWRLAANIVRREAKVIWQKSHRTFFSVWGSGPQSVQWALRPQKQPRSWTGPRSVQLLLHSAAAWETNWHAALRNHCAFDAS